SLPHVGTPGLELWLHEHDGLPARRAEAQNRWQREPHRDERDVADRELRGERELGQRARVRSLEHGHARIRTEARVKLPVADVDGDDARGASLKDHVGEAAGRSTDVDAVETARVD